MSYCQQFHENPSFNPETGRRITIGGPTYRRYAQLCGQPPGPVPAYLEESIRGLAPAAPLPEAEGQPQALVIVRGPYFNEAYAIPLDESTRDLIVDLMGVNDETYYIGSTALRALLSQYYLGQAGNITGNFPIVINLNA